MSKVQELLLEEIERVIGEAKREGATLRVGYHAGLLAAAYPNIFSVGRIMDELIMAASKEGIAAEIARPGNRQSSSQESSPEHRSGIFAGGPAGPDGAFEPSESEDLAA